MPLYHPFLTPPASAQSCFLFVWWGGDDLGQVWFLPGYSVDPLQMNTPGCHKPVTQPYPLFLAEVTMESSLGVDCSSSEGSSRECVRGKSQPTGHAVPPMNIWVSQQSDHPGKLTELQCSVKTCFSLPALLSCTLLARGLPTCPKLLCQL